MHLASVLQHHHEQNPASTELHHSHHLRCDMAVYCSSTGITEVSEKISTYLKTLTDFLDEHDLLSEAKSTITLFTADPRQAKTASHVLLYNTPLRLERNPKILGLRYDTMFSFDAHVNDVQKKVNKRNNTLRRVSGTDWGQDGKRFVSRTWQ